MGAIHYDVESVVSVAIDGIGEIFNGKKVKKIISDNIMQEMKARLTDMNIKIKWGVKTMTQKEFKEKVAFLHIVCGVPYSEIGKRLNVTG